MVVLTIVTEQGANLFFDIIFTKNRVKIKQMDGSMRLLDSATFSCKFKVLQEPTYLSAKANVFCSRINFQRKKQTFCFFATELIFG